MTPLPDLPAMLDLDGLDAVTARWAQLVAADAQRHLTTWQTPLETLAYITGRRLASEYPIEVGSRAFRPLLVWLMEHVGEVME